MRGIQVSFKWNKEVLDLTWSNHMHKSDSLLMPHFPLGMKGGGGGGESRFVIQESRNYNDRFPGSRPTMQSYIPTHASLKRGNILWIHRDLP